MKKTTIVMPDYVVKKLRELQAELMLQSSKRVGLSTVVNMLVNESLAKREAQKGNKPQNGEIVTKAIEDTLLEFGEIEYQTIQNVLSKDYNISINDCVKHPEYLKRVLQDVYGNVSSTIIAKIGEKYQKSDQQAHEEFFQILNK